MRVISVILLTLFLSGCDDKAQPLEEVKKDSLGIIGDSTISKITIDTTHLLKQFSITNTTYSLANLNYKGENSNFIEKRTVFEDRTHPNETPSTRSKIEFFDFQFKKVFEITADRRTIELKQDYFVTHGLFKDHPPTLELNNYETNEAFVSCWGKCLVVKDSHSQTIAHFGYSPLNFSIDTTFQIIGVLSFSINQEIEQELYIWQNPPSRFQSLVNIKLVPRQIHDKVSYSLDPKFETLVLSTNKNREGKKSIHGFDIILTLKRQKELESGAWEKIEHIISIVDGKVTGANITGSGEQLDLTLD